MDLRRLEYFLAVVEHGRVTVAANELHVAQPSLSQAIRALERDLGAELFVRSGRGLSPTAAGLALVEPARRVLRDLAAARSAVGDVIELTAGWLDIAAHDRLGYDPLATVLAAFHRRHGGVPVRLHEPRTEDELVRMLVDGRCELALAYQASHDGAAFAAAQAAALTVRRVGEHEVWVLLPPGSDASSDDASSDDASSDAGPDALPDPLPLAALDGRVVIDSMTGFGPMRTAVLRVLRASGIRLRPGVRTAHVEAITPLVLAGAGIAFTSGGYARQAARSGAVARRLDPTLAVDLVLLHRPGGLSPAARGFVSVLHAELGLDPPPADTVIAEVEI
jgi:DNA-binding transcriptional LysR family regulator